MKRILLTLCLFLLVPLASAARLLEDGPKTLNDHVIGSTPNVTIRGVTSGAAPWVVDEGRARLDPNGRLRVKVRGLLIAAGALANGDPVPANLVGTLGPVTMVHAALTCGGPGGGTPFTITSTDAVPLNPAREFRHRRAAVAACCLRSADTVDSHRHAGKSRAIHRSCRHLARRRLAVSLLANEPGALRLRVRELFENSDSRIDHRLREELACLQRSG